MNFEEHPRWNPFIKSISGEQREGCLLKISLQPPGGGAMKFKPRILKLKEGSEFRWKGKLFVPGIFDGEHFFILKPVNAHSTRFIHGESFSGIMIPFTGNMLSKTKQGFELMNDALKRECEKPAPPAK